MHQQRNGSPLAFIAEAIAYFISGSWVIGIITPRLSSPDEANVIVNLLTIAFGILSIIVGFLLLVNTLHRIKMSRFGQLLDRSRNFTLVILFPVTLPQIIPVLFSSSHLMLSISAGLFLLLVIVAILITSWPVFKKDVSTLLTMSLMLLVTTIIRFLQGVGPTEIVLLLVTVCILIIFTIYRLSGVRERQPRLFKLHSPMYGYIQNLGRRIKGD